MVAAYLYWMTIEGSDLGSPAANVGTFRGSELSGHQIAPPGANACWGSGGGAGTTSQAQHLRVYRADVLRYLPVVRDADGKPTSKRQANGEHVVSLPDSGGGGSQSPSSGNQATYVEGVKPGCHLSDCLRRRHPHQTSYPQRPAESSPPL